jgi:hypothetical protein
MKKQPGMEACKGESIPVLFLVKEKAFFNF